MARTAPVADRARPAPRSRRARVGSASASQLTPGSAALGTAHGRSCARRRLTAASPAACQSRSSVVVTRSPPLREPVRAQQRFELALDLHDEVRRLDREGGAGEAQRFLAGLLRLFRRK